MADWTAVERCRKPTGFGKRHVLALLGFSGFALSYAMRFSLSIAIVAMVNNNAIHHGKIRQTKNADSFSHVPGTPEMIHNTNSLQSNSVLFKSDVCPHDTTPHSALDLKLNLYHVQTTFVDQQSTSLINSSTGKKDSTDNNSYSFEVGATNMTKNSLLSTTTTTYDEIPDLNKNVRKSISSETVAAPAVLFTTNPNKETVTQHVENFDEDEGEFFWNEKEQGVILGSFFWGYVLTQAFGGWISQKIGGKWPFGVGLLITGLFAIVTPAAARLGGMPAVIVVRIVQGLAGGVTVPSMQAMLSKWFPPEERGKLGSLTFAGMPFGTFLSTLCSGFLIFYFGWTSVFYVTGVMTVIWFVLWSCFAYASPFEHPTINTEELQYIKKALQLDCPTKRNKTPGGDGRGEYQQQSRKQVPVPWSRVLLSLPFWAILVCNTCETWGLYTINSELPTYMKTVLHFDIKQNSVMSAFPHLLTLIVSIILTNVGDTLIEHQYLSIGVVRKLSTSIAMWGSAAALLGVAYSGCDRVKTVALLATAIGANGGKFGGFLVNIIDIAPNYSGILMGTINTIASLPGFFAPWVAGMIINENPSLENWRMVFLITAAIAFVGNLVFILCASGVEQSWNRGDDGTSENCCGTPSTDDKILQSATESMSMDCRINQKILLNKASNQLNSNKEEWENKGVFIIPLNPPVEAFEQHIHQQEHLHHHQPESPPFPLIAVRNVQQQQYHQNEQLDEDDKGVLRCSA